MADKVIVQSDSILKRLDARFALDASYVVVGENVVDPVTGTQTPSLTTIPNIKVRSRPLSIRELSEITSSGLQQVETIWRMRQSYVPNARTDDELHLISSGFKYLILRAELDALQLDWQLFTRRLR